jgi:hypothetical protein
MSRVKRSPRPPQFDMRLFYRSHWDRSAKLVSFFKGYGVNVPEPTAYKWRERASIPGPYFALLLCFLEIERGQPISLIPFIKEQS